MAQEKFISENSQLSKDQFKDLRVFDEPQNGDENSYETEPLNCGLEYVGNEGNYGIMRATRMTAVLVDHVRDGKVKSSIWVHMNAGDNLKLLNNNDGRNYDGYRC